MRNIDFVVHLRKDEFKTSTKRIFDEGYRPEMSVIVLLCGTGIVLVLSLGQDEGGKFQYYEFPEMFVNLFAFVDLDR